MIKNFTIYKIRGFEEGVLIFLNYENDIDQYDADIVKDLVGHVGSLYSITIKPERKCDASISGDEETCRSCRKETPKQASIY